MTTDHALASQGAWRAPLGAFSADAKDKDQVLSRWPHETPSYSKALRKRFKKRSQSLEVPFLASSYQQCECLGPRVYIKPPRFLSVGISYWDSMGVEPLERPPFSSRGNPSAQLMRLLGLGKRKYLYVWFFLVRIGSRVHSNSHERCYASGELAPGASSPPPPPPLPPPLPPLPPQPISL